MPAFTFEKIPAPPRIEGAPVPAPVKHRSKLGRLVDRLTELRLQSYDVRNRARDESAAQKSRSPSAPRQSD